VGANLFSKENAMQARTFRRAVAAAVAVFAVAAAATVAFKPWEKPMLGVATGEYVNGLPVYRLPSVSVTVSRKAELAKMAQEEAVASARQ